MCKTLGLEFFDSVIVTSDNQMLSIRDIGLASEYNALFSKLNIKESIFIEKVKEMEKEDEFLSIKNTCERIEKLEKKVGGDKAKRETIKHKEIMKKREGESIREYNIRVREELKKQREEGE